MLKFAFRNLMSRRLRSALSLMGLTVAIAGMVGLFAVKGGLEKTVNETFRMIPGLTVMQPGAPVPLFSKLPAKWEADLKQVEGVGVVNTQIVQRANLVEGKMTFNPPRFLLGMDLPSRLQLRRDPYGEHLTAGRYLRLSDRGSPNVVISAPIAREFDKRVGDTLRVDSTDLNIVGVYDTGLPLLDVAILIDKEQVRRMSRIDRGTVSLFYVEKSSPEIPDAVVKQRIREKFRGRSLEEWRPSSANTDGLLTGNPLIDALLRLVRRFSSPDEAVDSRPPEVVDPTKSPVEIRTADDWAQRLEQFSEDLDIFLTIMTGIGMTIATLSIVNTMLMSVSERIIEFGILKANGWSPRHVLKLITLESGLIGIGGGVLGAICGWVATQMLNSHWPERIELFASPGLLGFSIVFSTIVGVLGGLYPAVWAMRMMPMDAIRRG